MYFCVHIPILSSLHSTVAQNSLCFTALPSLALLASCNVNAAISLILQAFASYIAKSPNIAKYSSASLSLQFLAADL